VSWYDAYAFCIWDGAFLPSEAEWNYAASGGSQQRVYPWGSTAPGPNANLAVYGCYYNGTGMCTGVTNIAPVGSVAAGNGRYGQADLAGNVVEWTLDSYASYVAPCDDCAYLDVKKFRALRSGAFGYAVVDRASQRETRAPDYLDDYDGFRCARSP
jgi:formylglycine-generating enzyme required for sulfatase activity